MKAKLNSFLIPFTALGAVLFLAPAVTSARSGARKAEASGQQTASGGATSGQALAGTWKLNRALSDDPAKKLVSDDNIATGETGTAVPMAGQTGGRPDAATQSSMGNMSAPPSGMSGIGGLGGPNGMGGGVPPMPATPPSHRWDTDKDRQKRLEGILPANSLLILTTLCEVLADANYISDPGDMAVDFLFPTINKAITNHVACDLTTTSNQHVKVWPSAFVAVVKTPCLKNRR